MADMRNASDGFAYMVNSTEGGYVQNITITTAILIRSEETGQFEVELNWCPTICPNLPYTEIYVTLPIKDGMEPMIIWSQSSLRSVQEHVDPFWVPSAMK